MPSPSPAGVPLGAVGVLVLERVALERAVGSLTPDVLATTTHGEVFAVEFAVTSFCNAQKIRRLQEIGLPVLEIDLSSLHHEDFDLSEVLQAVCFSRNNRRWLLADAPDVAANSIPESEDMPVFEPHVQPVPPPPPPSVSVTMTVDIQVQANTACPSLPPSERYRLPEGIVVVRPISKRDVAIWHPFRRQLRDRIEPLCRAIPGAWWHGRYRNWIVPADRAHVVRAALRRLQGNR